MTRFKLVLGFGIVTALIIAGCKKNDLAPAVPPINIIVKLNYDTVGGNYNFPKNGIQVKITNELLGSSNTITSDNDGLAIFNSASAGIYTISTSYKMAKAQFESVTGTVVASDSVVFNASLSGLTLNSSTNNTVTLTMQPGQIGDWVIKQLYYAGSHTTNGAVQRDQFIEIYNNSNDTLYADSLYVTQLAGNNTAFTKVDLTQSYYLKDESDILYKQFDWSKSIGMPAALGDKANRSYVYTKTLFRVPGTGKTYPVAPGASFIIAATALNHKAPYTNTSGTAVAIKDPSLTVDLSGADFEVYLGNIISNPLNTDIDNPAVTNMIVIKPVSNRDLVLDPTGRDAIAIFKTNKDIVTSYAAYPDPSETKVDSSTSLFYQIPNELIIDAMQLQNPSPTATQRVARKLVSALDGGVTNVPAGQYSSQSSIRKTVKTISGRKILMDTNNSTNDFDYLDKAEPKAFKN